MQRMMIVIMTVICSFGNAEDVTMIVIIRVVILIIFMMIVIIVIAFIIVIMIVIIISSLSFIHFKCGVRRPWSCRGYYDDSYQTVIRSFGTAEDATTIVLIRVVILIIFVKRRQGDVPWDAVHRTLQLCTQPRRKVYTVKPL